jgi:hypothetical protein
LVGLGTALASSCFRGVWIRVSHHKSAPTRHTTNGRMNRRLNEISKLLQVSNCFRGTENEILLKRI